jgi:hypothetical protein
MYVLASCRDLNFYLWASSQFLSKNKACTRILGARAQHAQPIYLIMQALRKAFKNPWLLLDTAAKGFEGSPKMKKFLRLKWSLPKQWGRRRWRTEFRGFSLWTKKILSKGCASSLKNQNPRRVGKLERNAIQHSRKRSRKHSRKHHLCVVARFPSE